MKLTAKHTKAINALVNEKNITDAAKVAGYTTQTLRVWMKDPDFDAALKQAKSSVDDFYMESLRVGINALGKSMQSACETIEALSISAEDEAVQLRAAVTIINSFDKLLSRHFNIKEIEEFEERLSALEEARE